ncbi:MAG: hypothetical protein M3Z66_20520 [Chloroflexota bacterium]|nr:hypothetical protein [Chloroflexota bacterium]
MPKPTGRTQPCSRADARTRLDHARKFLDVGQLVADPDQELEYTSAAADAACCHALGRRSRGPDHHDAVDLVGQVTPGGTEAARALRRVLDLKDQAHYGLFDVSGTDLRAATRQAEALVSFAGTVVQG